MAQRDELETAMSVLAYASRHCGMLHERGSLVGPLGGERQRRFAQHFSQALVEENTAKAALARLFAERDCGHPCHQCAGLDACREAMRDAASV